MIISATQVQGNLSCMWYYTGLPNPTQIQTTATKDCTQKLICAGTVRCIGKDNFGVKRNGNEEIVTITCNAQVAGECPGATDCYNKENVGYTIVGATYKTEENTYAPQVPQSQRR